MKTRRGRKGGGILKILFNCCTISVRRRRIFIVKCSDNVMKFRVISTMAVETRGVAQSVFTVCVECSQSATHTYTLMNAF